MSATACYQPGWDDGPTETGGEPNGYQCERGGDHEGDHGWGGLDATETTWPIAEPVAKEPRPVPALAAGKPWEPDWRVHPGESLQEAIEALGMTQATFARKIGVTPAFVSLLVHGHKGIGPKVALKLEAAGVGPAQFWLGMQMQYNLHRAREAAAK